MAYAPAAPMNRYALKRQSPLTQGAQLAEDQNTQGLQTGNFADVQSAQKATQRANAARSSQALQAARGTVARSGGDFSPQAAVRAQDMAFAGANAQNLDATNQVNQFQRQYRQDALNRADAYEQNAQTGAIGERNYQSNLDAADLAQKNQEVGFGFQDRQLGQTDTAQANEMTRYNLSRGDANSQFDKSIGQRDKEFGITTGLSQQQINNQADQFGKTLSQRDKEFGVQSAQTDRQLGQTDTAQANEMTRYNLTRGDQNTQFDKTLGQRQNEFNVTSGQSQQQIDNQAAQFDKNYGLDATRVDQSQQQINNQASQFDKNYGLDATRVDQSQQQINNQARQYDLSRGDQNAQFAVTSGQNQQQIDNQASQAAAQLGYNYASLSQQDKQYFQDLAQRQTEFSVTSGQGQQQIDNQAAQAAAQLGYNYASLSQQDKQYFQDLAQRQTEFGVTSAQTDRQLGQTDTAQKNEMDRYNLSRGDTLAQNSVQNAQQDRLIGLQETRLTADTTDAQYQKTMDAIGSIADPKAKSAAMSAYLRGEDVSQFISGTLYGSDGSLNKDYASASPGEQKVKNLTDELKSTYPNKTDKEIQAMVQKRLEDADAAINAPLTVGKDQATAAEITKKINSGAKLTPTETAQAISAGAIPSSTPAALTQYAGKDGATKLASQSPGGMIAIGGQAYKVTGGEQVRTGKEDGFWGTYYRHTDYTELEAPDGTKKYIYSNGDGILHDTKPVAV